MTEQIGEGFADMSREETREVVKRNAPQLYPACGACDANTIPPGIVIEGEPNQHLRLASRKATLEFRVSDDGMLIRSNWPGRLLAGN